MKSYFFVVFATKSALKAVPSKTNDRLSFTQVVRTSLSVCPILILKFVKSLDGWPVDFKDIAWISCPFFIPKDSNSVFVNTNCNLF